MSQVVRVALAVVVILSLVALAVRLAGRGGATSDGGVSSDGLPAASTDERTPTNSPTRRPGFRAATDSAGIAFRMNFLPGEQGATFKANLYDHGSGVAVGDVNGDGHDDIYFCNQLGPNALYRNKGDGTFEDVTAESGPIALDDRICVGATFSDYDNDGDQDLFVTSTRAGNTLFQNDGQGHFQDVTEAAGVTFVGHSQTPCFFDSDQDGDLDLLVLNTAAWTLQEYNERDHYYTGPEKLFDLAESPIETNLLYRNNSDGTFTDVSAESGLQGRGWAADVAVFDYDEDGRSDILLTNMFGLCQLYHNEGSGRFRDVTDDTLRRTSYGGMGAKAFDIDNDGRLDLYIVDMHSDMLISPDFDPRYVEEYGKFRLADETRPGITSKALERERKVVDGLGDSLPKLLFGNSCFKNLGDGKFAEVSDNAGLENYWPWGIAAGDFDNDGDEDAFVPAGMGYPFFYWRNYLLMNDGDGTFTDESAARGLDPPPGGTHSDEKIAGQDAARSSRAAAVSDFDGDGRLDLVVNNFNDRPYYYRNEFPSRNYVKFRLRGTRSNRDAIGAVVRLHFADGAVLVRQVDAAGGYLAQSSKTLHFGLGKRDRIDRAVIRWPSGIEQTIDSPDINSLHAVEEPDATDQDASTQTGQ